MYAIETKNLSKNFQTHKAVDAVDLKIPVGAICGFLGRNGAGKTTTIKMLMGLLKPTEGEIILMGQKRQYGKIENANIGYLPDVPNFYPYCHAANYSSCLLQFYRILNSYV